MGHPSYFQRVSRLGNVTAGHSSIGRQPNFAALNRGRHLYSAGRPSRWALAHILVIIIITITIIIIILPVLKRLRGSLLTVSSLLIYVIIIINNLMRDDSSLYP